MAQKDTHRRIWITKSLHQKIKKMSEIDGLSFKETLETMVHEALIRRIPKNFEDVDEIAVNELADWG